MIRDIFMPALSSTMTEGKIVSWLKQPGDRVEKGETIVVVESDKADMDVESFYSGFLATIITAAGQEAPVGSAIALLAETEAEIEQAKQQAQGQASATPAPAVAPVAVAAPTPTTAPAPTAPAPNGRIVASPRAKKLAKQFKVDLATVNGTGPYGRIVAADVESAAGQTPSAAVVTATPTPVATPAPVPQPIPAPATPGEVKPMNTLQKAVVKNMMASLQVPDFRVGYTITTDGLDALYKQVKPKGVTMTALLAKAVAMTLQKHPIVNASYVNDGIHYASGINVSIAVAMPDGGLITPVLKNADQLDLYSLSRNWQDLVARARAKQLQPDEYNSGTFTISNLGMFGVDRFDAILPPGQGAIMAVGASKPQLVAGDDGQFGVKRQMQVNLTCDHRIIYGADAASFLKDLAKLIETNPQSLTL
ncbi:dihydrolipoamide acetyltransferase family protein [Spirulina sp. CCNP1310]|uniref:dihydrolipoamide acetyltransferase family protein n=1 Tax=Spirulina sp. CCNP1310 TaxID=3110249 RepID=UPI002B20BB9D|nr:dihydrolipoamide acetyltransferase family protein [Spirulina sp. CCNP1310]MEA5421341.1 dihydrolipoamide acetyltransferase family protein [Spirulina sp. CCNP1310]